MSSKNGDTLGNLENECLGPAGRIVCSTRQNLLKSAHLLALYSKSDDLGIVAPRFKLVSFPGENLQEKIYETNCTPLLQLVSDL